jgi:hypothetical protein
MDNFAVTDPTDQATFAFIALAIITAALTASGWLMTRLAGHVLRPVVESPDATLTAATATWWRRRLFGIALGMFVGSSVLTWSVWWLGADRSGSAADWVVVGGVAGGVVGAGVHRAFVGSSDGRTTSAAHSKRLRLVDFTPAWLRYAARIAVLLSVLLMIGLLLAFFLAPRTSGGSAHFPTIFLTPTFILTALGVLALIRFELSGRLIVGRSSSAYSGSDLAIDVILRCLAVRDLALGAALVGALGSLLLLPDLALSWDLSFLGSYDLATLEAFKNVVGVLACVAAAIAIFVPARIRPPIGLPQNSLVEAEKAS